MFTFFGSFNDLILELAAMARESQQPWEPTEEAAALAAKRVNWDEESILLCMIEARCLVAQQPR